MGRDPIRTRNRNVAVLAPEPAPLTREIYTTDVTYHKPQAYSCSHVDLAALIEEIAGIDDDGYLRAVPGNDSKSWYLSYNWTRGPHAGYYVMAVCFRSDLAEGYRVLRDKVADVRAGTRRPARNKYAK